MRAQSCVTRASVGTNVVNQKLSAHPVITDIREAKQADTHWRHSVESGTCRSVTVWPKTPWVKRLTGMRGATAS